MVHFAFWNMPEKNKCRQGFIYSDMGRAGRILGKKKMFFILSIQEKLLFTGDHAFYAITKSMIVDTMEYYKQEYGLKNFVFRLPNVYLYHPEKYYYVDCVKKPDWL